jgi:hypothetical protein
MLNRGLHAQSWSAQMQSHLYANGISFEEEDLIWIPELAEIKI